MAPAKPPEMVGFVFVRKGSANCCTHPSLVPRHKARSGGYQCAAGSHCQMIYCLDCVQTHLDAEGLQSYHRQYCKVLGAKTISPTLKRPYQDTTSQKFEEKGAPVIVAKKRRISSGSDSPTSVESTKKVCKPRDIRKFSIAQEAPDTSTLRRSQRINPAAKRRREDDTEDLKQEEEVKRSPKRRKPSTVTPSGEEDKSKKPENTEKLPAKSSTSSKSPDVSSPPSKSKQPRLRQKPSRPPAQTRKSKRAAALKRKEPQFPRLLKVAPPNTGRVEGLSTKYLPPSSRLRSNLSAPMAHTEDTAVAKDPRNGWGASWPSVNQFSRTPDLDRSQSPAQNPPHPLNQQYNLAPKMSDHMSDVPDGFGSWLFKDHPQLNELRTAWDWIELRCFKRRSQELQHDKVLQAKLAEYRAKVKNAADAEAAKRTTSAPQLPHSKRVAKTLQTEKGSLASMKTTVAQHLEEVDRIRAAQRAIKKQTAQMQEFDSIDVPGCVVHAAAVKRRAQRHQTGSSANAPDKDTPGSTSPGSA